MKRKITILVFTIGILLLIITPFFFMNHHHNTAADYERVLRIVDIELPDIAEVQSWDNYDRGASRWDCLEHALRFKMPLQESTIEELERRCTTNSHWRKDMSGNKIFYEYTSEPEWKSDLYFISCRIYEDGARIEYYIDEDEGIFCILIQFLVVFLGVVGFVVWLLVMAISKILKKKGDTR